MGNAFGILAFFPTEACDGEGIEKINRTLSLKVKVLVMINQED